MEEEYFYKYFVAFAYVNSDDRVEFGNSKFQSLKKIRSFEDAEEVQSYLNEKIVPKGVEKKQLVLLSYQELFE